MKFIGEAFNVERYRMRSTTGGYPGDLIENHVRVINGKPFQFSRIRWGTGDVTVRVWVEGTTTLLHEFES